MTDKMPHKEFWEDVTIEELLCLEKICKVQFLKNSADKEKELLGVALELEFIKHQQLGRYSLTGLQAVKNLVRKGNKHAATLKILLSKPEIKYLFTQILGSPYGYVRDEQEEIRAHKYNFDRQHFRVRTH